MLIFLTLSYSFLFYLYGDPRDLHSFPTRRSSDLLGLWPSAAAGDDPRTTGRRRRRSRRRPRHRRADRSEEHTSELQSRQYLVCRLLLEKKKSDKQHNALRPT